MSHNDDGDNGCRDASDVKHERVKVTNVRRLWRQTRLRGLAVGLAVLLIIGIVASYSTSPSLGQPNSYAVIDPSNGQVIASGSSHFPASVITLDPRTGRVVSVTGQTSPPGTIITLDPNTGRVVSVTGQTSPPGTVITLNPKTGQLVKVSR
jgi:hypothetical protein